MIFLDTNVVIGCLNGRAPRTLVRLAQALEAGLPIALPAIVWFELRYGAAKSAWPDRNRQRLLDFRAGLIDIIGFDPGDGEEAADIRAELERLGTPIGPYDTLIAAQARRRSVRLVTANEGEFRRVPGLLVENWEA
jgi:tRNA(fMet)-specific endonuclease VapC